MKQLHLKRGTDECKPEPGIAATLCELKQITNPPAVDAGFPKTTV